MSRVSACARLHVILAVKASATCDLMDKSTRTNHGQGQQARNLKKGSLLPNSGGVMPVLADDFLARRDRESSSLSLPDRQDPGSPMVRTARIAQGPSEAARALVEGLSRRQQRAPLPRLRRATQAPATGLLRQVPSRTQPAAASTAPSRPGSADPGAARRCPRPDGQGWAAVSRQHLCPGGSGDEYGPPVQPQAGRFPGDFD